MWFLVNIPSRNLFYKQTACLVQRLALAEFNIPAVSAPLWSSPRKMKTRARHHKNNLNCGLKLQNSSIDPMPCFEIEPVESKLFGSPQNGSDKTTVVSAPSIRNTYTFTFEFPTFDSFRAKCWWRCAPKIQMWMEVDIWSLKWCGVTTAKLISARLGAKNHETHNRMQKTKTCEYLHSHWICRWKCWNHAGRTLVDRSVNKYD